MTSYFCSACKKPVIILPGATPVKTCKCKAAVTASVSATAKGHGRILKN